MANNNNIKNGKAFATGVVRIQYPFLAERDTKGEMPTDKYSVTLLIPKSDVETMNKINKAICETGGVDSISKIRKHPLVDDLGKPKDGDLPEHVIKEGYAGHYFFKVTTDFEPTIMCSIGDDSDAVVIKDPEIIKREFYSGCYCTVVLSPCQYIDKRHKDKAVTFFLTGIRKVAEGQLLKKGAVEIMSMLLGAAGASPIASQSVEPAPQAQVEAPKQAPINPFLAAAQGKKPEKKGGLSSILDN